MTDHTEKLLLAEQPYVSIQGEGQFVGMPMMFVRLQGCNVGCKWCDSYYTWAPFNQEQVPAQYKGTDEKAFYVDFAELDKIIESSGVLHVWITGGEPLLQKIALGEYLRNSTADVYFHVCTSGQIYDKTVARHASYICVDVKAPTSGVKINRGDLSKWFQEDYLDIEFKMVVANNKQDRDFALEMVSGFGDKAWTLQPLYYSEIAVNSSPILLAELNGWKVEEFAQWVNENFRSYDNVRMGLQLHKHIWTTQSRGI